MINAPELLTTEATVKPGDEVVSATEGGLRVKAGFGQVGSAAGCELPVPRSAFRVACCVKGGRTLERLPKRISEAAEDIFRKFWNLLGDFARR